MASRRPVRLWQLELRGTLARRRALAIKLAFPLVLVIPLVAAGAPPFFAGTCCSPFSSPWWAPSAPGWR